MGTTVRKVWAPPNPQEDGLRNTQYLGVVLDDDIASRRCPDAGRQVLSLPPGPLNHPESPTANAELRVFIGAQPGSRSR